MPASGLPRTTRGQSPQASCGAEADAPRAGARSPGTSSTRIQCSWMFCRSVMSAVSRANVVEMSAMVAQLRGRELAAVDADAEHEVLVVELVRLEDGGAAAVDAGPALGVEAPPAEPAAQVGRVDRGEAAVGVDVLDAGPDVERVVVLLGLLVGVERLAVAERPLALAALAPGERRARSGRGGRRCRWRCWGVSCASSGGGGARSTAGESSTLRGRRSATARPANVWRARVMPTYTSCCASCRSPRGVEPRGARERAADVM